MKEKWHIKEASQQSKISEDTIRFYEKEGLIKPERGENRYRQYTEKNLKELQYIAVMKYAHFSVKEIGAFMNLMHSPLSENCNAKGQELLGKKIMDLEQAIHHYQQIIELLQELPMPDSYSEYLDKRDELGEYMDQFIGNIFNSIYEVAADESN